MKKDGIDKDIWGSNPYVWLTTENGDFVVFYKGDEIARIKSQGSGTGIRARRATEDEYPFLKPKVKTVPSLNMSFTEEKKEKRCKQSTFMKALKDSVANGSFGKAIEKVYGPDENGSCLAHFTGDGSGPEGVEGRDFTIPELQHPYAPRLIPENMTKENDVMDKMYIFSEKHNIDSYLYPGYGDFITVLQMALDQSARGKGRERHGGDNMNFMDQPIMSIAKMTGLGYLTGQSMKKIQEAGRLLTIEGKGEDAAVNELLGSIVYNVAAVLFLLKQKGESHKGVAKSERRDYDLGTEGFEMPEGLKKKTEGESENEDQRGKC